MFVCQYLVIYWPKNRTEKLKGPGLKKKEISQFV